jgi:GNAT superfamily N-acetyltransferase
LVRQLAEYEELAHLVASDDAVLNKALFGERRYAEAVVGKEDGEPVAFALYFFTYSTFLGKPGLYLEDLFVDPESRGKGYGKALLKHLAGIAVEHDCGRFEWRVLDWNEPSIRFYEALGGTIMKEWLLVRMTAERFTALANR